MKTLLIGSATLILAVVSSIPAQAQVVWCSPALNRPLGVAPSPSNMPGFYWYNYQGMRYGPSYCLRPPFCPEGGVGPGKIVKTAQGQAFTVGHPIQGQQMMITPQGQQFYQPVYPGHGAYGQGAQMVFPSHPYARSPRDFFMWSEGMEDELNRLRLPALTGY